MDGPATQHETLSPEAPGFLVPRERTRWQRVRVPLLTGGLVGAATIALHFRDPHEAGSWGYCPFSALTGLYCPGCGGLRAVNDLTNGDVLGAASSNLVFVAAGPAHRALVGAMDQPRLERPAHERCRGPARRRADRGVRRRAAGLRRGAQPADGQLAGPLRVSLRRCRSRSCCPRRRWRSSTQYDRGQYDADDAEHQPGRRHPTALDAALRLGDLLARQEAGDRRADADHEDRAAQQSDDPEHQRGDGERRGLLRLAVATRGAGGRRGRVPRRLPVRRGRLLAVRRRLLPVGRRVCCP